MLEVLWPELALDIDFEFAENFITLWKAADPGIAEVDDARERVARLKNQ